MVTFITQFPVPAGLDVQSLAAALVGVAPEFRKTPGLLSKAFLISDDGTKAGGVYLWRSKRDAMAFEPVLRDMIRERMGQVPEITYFHTPVVVDNVRGTIESSVED